MSTPGESCRILLPNRIAMRRLAVVGDPGRELVIVVGKPRWDPEPGGDWICPYLVEGLHTKRRFAHGIDSIQALQMAFEAAKVAITEAGLVCTYGHSEPGDIGIPRTIPTFGGAGRDFAPGMERYLDRELKKLEAQVLSRPPRSPRR